MESKASAIRFFPSSLPVYFLLILLLYVLFYSCPFLLCKLTVKWSALKNKKKKFCYRPFLLLNAKIHSEKIALPTRIKEHILYKTYFALFFTKIFLPKLG